jgi:hypothetical protein
VVPETLQILVVEEVKLTVKEAEVDADTVKAGSPYTLSSGFEKVMV